VHARGQPLARPPGTQGAGRIGGLPVPAGQGALHHQVVAPQHQHVDVGVLAHGAADGQLDGMPAGDPPGRAALAEERRDLGRTGRVPGAPRGDGGRHALIVAAQRGRNGAIPIAEFPSALVISRDGRITARVIGAVTYPDLARLIGKVAG
jgi:hypothetical protein